MPTDKELSWLCAFCADLFTTELTFRGNLGYLDSDNHRPCQSIEEYTKAVNDRCHLCVLFSLYRPFEIYDRLTAATWIEYVVIEYITGGRFGVQQLWKSDGEGPPLYDSEFILLLSKNETPHQTKLHPQLINSDRYRPNNTQSAVVSEASNNSNSERTYSLVRKWLEKCDTHHSLCSSHDLDDKFLPTRLLDVGGVHNKVSLCLSKSLRPLVPKYMTLSHCWGGQVPLTLTVATLARFLDEIDHEQLPKTFREAIQVTRNLGIRYIWIDSLCIIQDSGEDWKYEAALMGRVYQHSWCNIAATKARDGRGGCFDERSPLLVTPCRIKTTWLGGSEDEFSCIPDGLWCAQIEPHFLSKRGWVFQEIALSPRVLHYSCGQVFWECCELRACESHPGDPDLSLQESTKFSLIPHPNIVDHNLHRKLEPLQFKRYCLWDRAVMEYTKRDLTFPGKDIFYAMSAIARSLVPSKEYLAGLWNSPDTLVEQLLWHTPPDSLKIRSAEYRAPSWSWACLDSAAVNFVGFEIDLDLMQRIYNHELVKVLGTDVTLVDSKDPYGPVTHASITLLGAVLAVPVDMLETRNPTGTLTSFANIAIMLNCDGKDPYRNGTVLCLPMRLDTSEEYYELGSFDKIHGLILAPVDNCDNEYTRQGYFQVDNLDYDDDDSLYDFNVLKFWNVLLYGIGSVQTKAKSTLVVEDLQPIWRDIILR